MCVPAPEINLLAAVSIHLMEEQGKRCRDDRVRTGKERGVDTRC